MTTLLPWLLAGLVYGGFRLFYDSWRGPLTKDEIESYLGRVAAQPDATSEGLASMHRFLAEDDGLEFIMVNLIRLRREAPAHPVTGRPTPAQRLLWGYISPFAVALLKRGGHPVFFGTASGGYVDSWGVPPDPGWSQAGLMRYRSRRDLAELATSGLFAEVHPFKRAAVESTFSIPTTGTRVFFGPRVWVALLLALAAALVT